jgi:hypothetical protein
MTLEMAARTFGTSANFRSAAIMARRPLKISAASLAAGTLERSARTSGTSANFKSAAGDR